jgi:arginine utilization protein RocB
VESTWYDEVLRFTQRLVAVESVSPGQGEIAAAREVLRLLHGDGLESLYTASGLDPIVGDAYGRQNAFAFLHGQSARTVVLLGHIDTVGIEDYGALAEWAREPQALLERQEQLAALTPGLAEDMAAHPGDWMLGRGSIDMKSGVAANIAVMRRLARQSRGAPLPLSVIFLATPDEENESAGVLQAVRFLLRMREEHGLEYLGAINTDYDTARYPGDQHHYAYTGTIGKLLPSFLVIGRESHVGEPFDGADANLLAAGLIADLSMNDELCDVVRGQATPPPVTLHATDLKARYDVQVPFAAWFYLNVLTFSTTPGELLEKLRSRAEAALAHALARIDAAQGRWNTHFAGEGHAPEPQQRHGTVLTYEELRDAAMNRLGEARVETELAEAWANVPEAADGRERSLHLALRLWALSGRQGPAVVLYYSPPYYPHVAAVDCPLHQAIAALAENHRDLNLAVREFYPYISDMSYLRLDPGTALTPLTANLPVWIAPGGPVRPGGYSLPLDQVRELGMPVVNLGPYGNAAHQRGERVLMSYSFGVLPQLIYETVERLGQSAES